MGLLSYLTPRRLKKGDEAAPVEAAPPVLSSAASSIDSLTSSAEFNYKYDLMIEYLHQQQTNFRWTSGGVNEGVIMKKAKDTYICCPPSLADVQDGFKAHIEALNVRVAMTVTTPVIRRFSGRSIISLANGQHLQVLPDMTWLSKCQKYQSAAFISNIGTLVVWSDDPVEIVDRITLLERELLSIIWQADLGAASEEKKETVSVDVSELPSSNVSISELEAGNGSAKRPRLKIIQPFGIACSIAMVFSAMGSGLEKLIVQASWDKQYIRFGLLLTVPFLTWFSLFFFQAFACSIIQMLGPIKQMHQNSKYFSGARPTRLSRHNAAGLPHITIQMPVYKEGLQGVIQPTIRSIKAAIATYEMQGGTANIFVNDDGMQLISTDLARARQDFYDENNIGWVARPKHNEDLEDGEVFMRRGKFKKASNMNYGMWVSTRVEDKLVAMAEEGEETDPSDAYERALEEVISEDNGQTWAVGNVRIGDYILIIDSDTRVPKDCLLDCVSEMEANPSCAVLQHASGVMNVTDSYFEKGITYFTNLVYDQIRYAVSSGDCAPFVGHNAVLRWSAIQYISYECPDDNREKWWSESAVSEDFDMSLRLQAAGYVIRMAAYTSPEGELFREGVSLTVYDELTRWEKYAYGCSELMFHPLKDWFRKGPITPIFRTFVRSRIPLSSKITLMAYIGTYYAIGAAWLTSLVNFFMVGWYLPRLDRFYYPSFGIFFALVLVFTVLGNVCLAVMRFRADNKPLMNGLVENLKWIPLMTIFMGGMSMHVSQALLSHLFSIEMSWGATAKELEDSTFFEELAKVAKKFKFTFAYCGFCVAMMVALALFVPEDWRIDTFTAIWPLAIGVASHALMPIALNPSLMFFAF